jgi:cytidylate kinase
MIHITIDGPSGAGKSTVAKAVAKKLNIIYLDTGAIYRAFAYAAMGGGIDVNDGGAVEKFLKNADIEVKYSVGNCAEECPKTKNGGAGARHSDGKGNAARVQRVFCNKIDVTEFIREHSVSKAASDISKHIPVRIRLSEIQREIAEKNDVVLDGRDAGTFVLPDANFKFFLTADLKARAERRYAELREKGGEIAFEKVLEDMKTRDFNDSNRSFAPLKQAEDARLVDSTHMTANEVAELIIKCVEGEKGRKNLI